MLNNNNPETQSSEQRRKKFLEKATQEREQRRERNKTLNSLPDEIFDILEEGQQGFVENNSPRKVSFADRIDIIPSPSDDNSRNNSPDKKSGFGRC